MAITNGLGQTKVGVRATLVQAQTLSLFLDTYSGAAAAYSLRKLTSTYTGDAIRVRRSSDNAEQNIGFDAGGNLDTVALSQFVGSGSGFVTTWYDQSGNGRNSSQTTASSQPQIVINGSLSVQNGKPALYFDGANSWLICSPFETPTYQSEPFSLISVMGLNTGYSTSGTYCPYGTYGSNQFRLRITNNKYGIYNGTTELLSTIDASPGQKIISNIFGSTDKLRVNGVEVISGNSGNFVGTYFGIGRSWWSGWYYNGYVQELVVYSSDQISNVSGLESNINSYYSSYPNSTTVWNLLKAVYSADTTSQSSLKTSLVASYNAESNTNDSFGTNNGTSVGGLTYGTGKIGNAFQFNGTNAYVSLPNNSLNFTGDFSISLWINLASLTGVQYLFNNFKQLGLTNYYGYTLFAYNNYIYFRIYNGTLSNYDTITPFSSTNTWANIVVTRKTSVTNKIYINGVLVVSGGAINPVYDSVMPYSMIGSYNDSNGDKFLANGSKIDAVSTWNKELTASEITELYNSGNGAQYIGDNFYKPTTNDALGINNGTAQGGLTYGPGKIGTAFQFNGTNAFVRLPNNAFNFTGDFSISAWIYYPTDNQLIGSDYAIILSNWNGLGWPIVGGWGFATFGNSISFSTYNNVSINSPSTISVITGAGVLALDRNGWRHIVVTRIANGQHVIYLDGVARATSSSVGNPLYSGTLQPMIGKMGDDVTTAGWNSYNSSKIKIDSVSVWNKSLTSTEITELYNSSNGKQYPY